MARRAGAILLEIYRTDFGVDFKDQSDPVTEADRRANAYLVEELRRHFPADGIVAEEDADFSDALRGGRCWYVDPLDGTKEFVKRNGEFSVMIGLAIDGEARVGVVYQPVGDKLYRGVVGGEAWLEEIGVARPLRVSEIAHSDNLRLVVSRSHRSAGTDAAMQRLGIHREMPSGSVGLKVGLIAEQSADIYIHMSDKSCAWDACGPEAILRAAGGRFSDLGGEPLRYGGSDLRNLRGLLACNATAYDAVLPILREVATEAGLLGGTSA